MATYDTIVLGVGGMGSAALYHLARRGQHVLGIDRYDVPNAMGSSHGVTRIIRLAYCEDPSYVPLLQRAFELWRELESMAGEPLLLTTGSLDIGPEDSQVYQGSRESCDIHGLPYETLSGRAVNQRHPGYQLPEELCAVYQPDGGLLLPERCIVAHVNAALKAGARVQARERALSWQPDGEGVRVTTDKGTYTADRLVISVGPWAGALLPLLAPLTTPERQVMGWFQPDQEERFQPSAFPVFNLLAEEGRYYGLPVCGAPGLKVGRYHHLEEAVDPDTMDREPNQRDEEALRTLVRRYFPLADGPTMALKTCIFTNTADEHFIIDLHPEMPQVVLAAGFSGHGFKFCSLVGEVLADLAQNGATRHDLHLFRLQRFQPLVEGETHSAEGLSSG